ncbi:MAG: HPr family phosphocarrier protein [bacterium]
MRNTTITIKHETGLHARPASQLAKKASDYQSEIKILKDNEEVNGKSVMGVMSLEVNKGDEITLEINGEDEDKAMEELYNLITKELPEVDNDAKG